jgi:hypothetical protein
VTWARRTDGRTVEEFRVDETVAVDWSETPTGADRVVQPGDEPVSQFTRDHGECGDGSEGDGSEGDGSDRDDDGSEGGDSEGDGSDVDRLRAVVTELDGLPERVEGRCPVRSVAEAADD